MRRFRVTLDTLIVAGGKDMLYSPELVETKDKSNITDDEKKREENRFKAIVFLKRSDLAHYSDFLTELQNNAHINNDMYPDSENDALELMLQRSGAFNCDIVPNTGRGSRNRDNRGGRGRGQGYNFAQNSNTSRQDCALPGTVLIAGTNGHTCNFKCYNCQKWGHYSDHCPEGRSGDRQGTGLMHVGFSMTQKENPILDSWIILDSSSTATVFKF